MQDELKDEIRQIVELTSSLPENLQLRCFELLVGDLLSRQGATPPPGTSVSSNTNGVTPTFEGGAGEDIEAKDIHVKTRKFMEQNQISFDQLNEVFYKDEEGAIQPLYEDLKSTKIAESQIRIALLQALRYAIAHGDLSFVRDEVRAECQTRKCYDGPNFASNFKNRTSFFESLDKDTLRVRLAEPGRKELAVVIKSLQ